MKYGVSMLVIAALAMPGAALAQDAAMVKMKKGEQYGQYLTDSQGRALYMFSADKQGKGGTEAEINCATDCLKAWPPHYSAETPKAGEGVDEAKLGRVEHEGRQIVTYNGWPLYYFAKDQGSDKPTGQDIESYGGEWYLVTPDGMKVHEAKAGGADKSAAASDSPQKSATKDGQNEAAASPQNGQGDPAIDVAVIALADWEYDNIYRSGWSAEQLLEEADVYGPGGEEIGSVENLILNRDGKIISLIAEVGSIWDIGDTHVNVPWDKVKIGEKGRVTIPVTEDTVAQYSLYAEGFLSKQEAKTITKVDDEVFVMRPWKATELMGDYARLNDGRNYGYISDLIFNEMVRSPLSSRPRM